jgi:ATP-binding cassette subfamily B protein
MSSPGAVSAATAGSEHADLQGLRQLGTGGDADRLDWRLARALLRRCAALLRPLRWHIAGLLGGFAALALTLFPIILLLMDTFWTRALQGEPLTSIEATLLGRDPVLSVHVSELSASLRRDLVRQVVVSGALTALVGVPFVLALFYYRVWILQRVNQLLRVELLDRLQSLSLRFHSDSRVGDSIYRLYQDSSVVTQLIDVVFLAPVMHVARFLFSLGVVSLFDPGLAVVLLFVWPPVLLIGARWSGRMRVRFRAARESNSRLTSRIQETLAGIRVIKAYGAERREQELFVADSSSAFAQAFSARSLFAGFSVAIFWVLGSGAIVAIALATLNARDALPLSAAALGFTAWNLGLYNAFKMQFGNGSDSIRDLFRSWARVQDVVIGLDRVFEILDMQPEVQQAEDAVALAPFRDRIRWRGVDFAYQAGQPVLRNIDLEAHADSITAIVGPTGSGKSTLVSLLLRLFDPDRGSVSIDGVDLRKLDVASLRNAVSIALQENVLFGETVRENIRFAVPSASDTQVNEAARVACADEFIASLPLGLDTLLGERGSKLSTGQRKRLTIARALLKNTPILVLDEPSASLDAATEVRLMRNLREWGRGRAVFLITHRLSTVRHADQIVFLQEGAILERGSHEDLMAGGGPYSALVGAFERTSPQRGSG